ncbi:hypothetical protein [Pseudorhizobium flavum]|uniref:hypothetical protein n=1 Tax=Pseudorhizobium flavum TaxID=1335061 RepID=UPI00376F97D7
MKSFTHFTYPTFLGLAGFFSALGDLIQNQTITLAVMMGLMLLGLACLCLPKSWTVERVWRNWLHMEVKEGFSPRGFGGTCIILAGLMWGFFNLSAQAADDGGIIASQYPKVLEVQMALGIVQRDVAEIKAVATEIKADTSQLLLAADQWMQFDLHLLHTASHPMENGEWVHIPSGSSVLVNNETNFQFEDVKVVLRDPGDTEIYRQSYENVLEKQQRFEREVIEVAYEDVSVCLSAKRRGKDEWLIDRHKMKIFYGPDQYSTEYRKYDSDGVKVHNTPTNCG